MKALLLTGGQASRLHPFTTTRPKPMLPIANRPILERNLLQLGEAGVTSVVIVTDEGEGGKQIRSHLGDGSALGLSVDKVIEMTTINPARALGEEQRRGSLKVGMPADVSILELTEGSFTFIDSVKNTIRGNLLLVPRLTLKSGVEILPRLPGGRE